MVPLPCFESFPVLHDLRLFFILIFSCILKSFLRLLLRVSLPVATHLTGLESALGSEASILPQQDCAFVVRTRKHTSQTIPAHTIHRAIVSRKHRQKPLRFGCFILKEGLHQVNIPLDIFFALVILLAIVSVHIRAILRLRVLRVLRHINILLLLIAYSVDHRLT